MMGPGAVHFHVADDPHNRGVHRLILPEMKFLPDGIAIGPKLSSHFLVDDYRRWRGGIICLVEHASLHQADLHRIEVSRRNDGIARARNLARIRRGAAHHRHLKRHAAIVEWDLLAGPGGWDLRAGADPLEDLIVTSLGFRGTVVLGLRERDFRDDQVLLLEPET